MKKTQFSSYERNARILPKIFARLYIVTIRKKSTKKRQKNKLAIKIFPACDLIHSISCHS